MGKRIVFDKYIPYTLETDADGNLHETRLDLNDLLIHIQDDANSSSLRDIYGAKYRFHVCKYHEKEQVWELQILHLRDALLPGIADEKKEFNLIQLPEGRYPAESCTALYSPEKNIIYLQRNIACITAKRLGYYLRVLLPEHTKLILKPIIKGNRIDKVTDKAVYKKVILACVNDPHRSNDDSGLGDLLKTAGRYNAPLVHVEIGVGRKRNNRLNSEEITKLLLSAYGDDDVQTLKVQLAPSKNDDFEFVNLLEDRDCFEFIMDYSRENPISHARLYSYCLEDYNTHCKGG